MMVTPSGFRSSEPVPPSSASGSAPNRAASVVIMIGRKRSRLACTMESRGRQALRALGLEREVDHHDGVLLDDAHQQHDADQRRPWRGPCRTSIRASSAPMPADGSVVRIVKGWTKLSYSTPSTM